MDEFAGPTAWLESRMKFSRTLAVMSFVGYVLGLGDRHSENILLDATTGAVVHVDFNCLFEKVSTRRLDLTIRGKALKSLNEFHFGSPRIWSMPWELQDITAFFVKLAK